MSNRYLELLPTNSNASFSFREGRPVITFQISEQESELLPASIRWCGNFNAYANAARAVPTDNLCMDSRIGIWSMIDQVVISSVVSHQTIEHVRNANRFYSTYFGVSNNEKKLIGSFGETGLTLPSLTGQQSSVVNESAYAASGFTNTNEFCIHIPTGLLLGTSSIPLSSDWGVGGLEISLHLAPESMVLFDKLGDPVTNGLTGAWYELTNNKLVCEVHDPSPEELTQLKGRGALEYNSFSGYYQTINSMNANINFSLGLSRVQSVIMNFIPASYLNNLQQNSMQTIYPLTKGGALANISQLTFTKGGSRFPLNYNLDTNFDDRSSVPDSQITRNFMNSVMPFTSLTHTSMSPANTNTTFGGTAGASDQSNHVLGGGSVFGVGISYDILGSNGADFSREAWGMQMDLELVDNNPIASYIFVHNKQTLLFKSGQVSVLS